MGAVGRRDEHHRARGDAADEVLQAAVNASAPGKVLYSGDGIRGYGKLVIIKHNAVYLSVYAHNSRLLVKEGQTVAKGQKIAEMGNSDADQVGAAFSDPPFRQTDRSDQTAAGRKASLSAPRLPPAGRRVLSGLGPKSFDFMLEAQRVIAARIIVALA